MAIQFSGEFTTPRSPEEVFDFLSDPSKFGPLLPDFQSMSMQDPTHFIVKVRVGVGNIRGSAEIKMELVEALRPLRAHYKGQGNAVGSQVSVSAGFDLTPLPESTRVVWQGETSVFGKLASMAGGLLEPLGKKNIQKLIDGLQQALARPAAPVTTEPARPYQTPAVGVEAVSQPPAEDANATSARSAASSDFQPPSAPQSQSNTELNSATSSAIDEEKNGNENAQPAN